MIRSALLSTSLLFTAGAAQAQTAPFYELTALGDLPGRGFQSEAWSINDKGQVVGFSASSGGQREAFVWDPVNGMQGLGFLGNNWSHAYGINNQGQIVGLADDLNGLNGQSAVLWDQTGAIQDLGDLPGGNDRGRAVAINDAGQATGWSAVAGGERAYIWDEVNGMVEFGYLPGGVQQISRGNDINEAGQIAGWSEGPDGFRAVIMDVGNGLQELGDLPDNGWDWSIGEGLNDQGQVVGYFGVEGRVRNGAFLWDEVNGYQELGDLEGGLELSQAYDINNDGTVIGFSRSDLGNRAFVWDEGNGIQDLNDLIDPALVSAGWALEFAYDINNSGQIVGFGRNANGQDEAFLLTPIPEPASLALLAVGGLLMARRNRD